MKLLEARAAIGRAGAQLSDPFADEAFEARKTRRRAYMPWTPKEDGRLEERVREGACVHTLAAEFERQPGAIRSRLKKLGLDAPENEGHH